MIRIETDGPSGDEHDIWVKKAQMAREELIDTWLRTNQVPELRRQIWKELKETFLNDVYQEKCAYCEARPTGSNPLDVEHYRPKGGVTQGREILQGHAGYFWLAYEWYNLILACRNCNSAHPVMESGERKSHPGKLNEFRIRVEQRRVYWPSDDPEGWRKELETEQPLLLDPYDCTKNPEEHIGFDENGIAYPLENSELGRETINVCDLNRRELVRDRRQAKERIYGRFFFALSQEKPSPDPFFPKSEPFSAWLNSFAVIRLREMAQRQGYDLARKNKTGSAEL